MKAKEAVTADNGNERVPEYKTPDDDDEDAGDEDAGEEDTGELDEDEVDEAGEALAQVWHLSQIHFYIFS